MGGEKRGEKTGREKWEKEKKTGANFFSHGNLETDILKIERSLYKQK